MNVRALLLLLLPAPFATGCRSSDDLADAVAAFEAFQVALQAQDEAGCRRLLTTESAPILDEMPWHQVATRATLHVVDVEREHPDRSTFLIAIEDPNDGDARAQFVVVREHGRLVVDLVASAERSAVAVEASAAAPALAPRALTPADHDRIRRYELSRPRDR